MRAGSMSAPVIVKLLVVFLAAPIVSKAWVSISDWTGIGSPFLRAACTRSA